MTTAAFDFAGIVADIVRAAGQRGLVLTLRDQIVADDDGGLPPEGEELVRMLRAAWAATDGEPARHAHVAQMAAAIAKEARDRRGPVRVSRTSWLLIKSYALTGRPPKKQEEIIAPRAPRKGQGK